MGTRKQNDDRHLGQDESMDLLRRQAEQAQRETPMPPLRTFIVSAGVMGDERVTAHTLEFLSDKVVTFKTFHDVPGYGRQPFVSRAIANFSDIKDVTDWDAILAPTTPSSEVN